MNISQYKRALFWVGATALFACSYGQSPLFHENYNTYLLHGFSQGGFGSLSGDWLAQTRDPFPVFSAFATLLVVSHQYWLFWVCHGLLLGVFLYAATQIALTLSRSEATSRADGRSGFERSFESKSVLLAFFVAAPLGWLGRDAIAFGLGGDWGWYLQAGFASQFLLGHVFQPSLFGVFLMASLAAFVRKRDAWALGFAAFAALMHFSYFIPATALVAGYTISRARTPGEDWRRFAGRAGLVLGAVGTLGLRFLPTDAAAADEAARILTEVRIPHHSVPEQWLFHRSVLWLQGPLLLLGVPLSWKTRLRWPYLCVFSLGAALFGIQLLTGSARLALLFPWRATVLLMPWAYVLLAGNITRRLWDRPPTRWAPALALIAGLVCALHGVQHSRAQHLDYHSAADVALVQYVQRTQQPGDVFVIPKTMKRLRLESGARVFVDFKSHPYLDREVLEWYRRIQLAERFQDREGAELCALAEELHAEFGATHFVRPSDAPMTCDALSRVYEDEHFVLWERDQTRTLAN